MANSQPLRLPDSSLELGTSIQTAMVKSLAQKVTHLQEQVTYALFKACILAIKDWLLFYTHTTQFETSNHLCHGSFDNEPRYIFLVGCGALWTM